LAQQPPTAQSLRKQITGQVETLYELGDLISLVA
jgi:hypothetical protein